MNDVTPNPDIIYRRVDTDAGVDVQAAFASLAAPSVVEEIRNAIALFEAYVERGGLALSRSPAARAADSRRLELDEHGMRLRFSPAALDKEALGVLLRLLRPAVAPAPLIVTAGNAAGEDMETAERRRVGSTPHPFVLELEPNGKWLTVECSNEAGFSPRAVSELDRSLRVWLDVARYGGFHVPIGRLEGLEDFDELESDEPGESGACASEPAVGADFISWQLNLPGMEAMGINGLINCFAYHAEFRDPFDHLYIG